MVEGGVPFPMLSNGGGRIGMVYGVYGEAADVVVGRIEDALDLLLCPQRLVATLRQ